MGEIFPSFSIRLSACFHRRPFAKTRLLTLAQEAGWVNTKETRPVRRSIQILEKTFALQKGQGVHIVSLEIQDLHGEIEGEPHEL